MLDHPNQTETLPINRWTILFCGLVGSIAFLLIYGPLTLDVTYDHWIFNGYVERDVIQHYAGWMAFRQAPWSFPLGLIPAFGGTAITFTDSIPWLSIFFKLISSFLPETFQFFGPYILVSMTLQGIAAGLILSLFSRSKAFILGGTVLLVTAPIMLERSFRHTALSSHWLILFAVWLLLRSRRTGKLSWGYCLISLLTIGIHPYFLPMIYALFAVNIAELWLIRHGSWKSSLLNFSLSAALSLSAGYAIGAFSSGTPGAIGFGYYSMNLNAPINPLSCAGLVWSRVLPTLPQTLGNYDGFNYFGLGILLAIPLTVLFVLIWERGQIKRNFILFLACLCLFLFAVSNVVTLHDQVVFQYPLPEKIVNLAGIFRASSRMFYPVYYLTMIAVLWCISRCKGHILLLAILLAVQLWDLSPILRQKRQFFEPEAVESLYSTSRYYNGEDWQDIAANFTSIKMLCNNEYNFALGAFGAKYGMPPDITISARSYSDLEAIYAANLAELTAGQADPDAVYLTLDNEAGRLLAETLPDGLFLYDMGDHIAITNREEAIHGLSIPRS